MTGYKPFKRMCLISKYPIGVQVPLSSQINEILFYTFNFKGKKTRDAHIFYLTIKSNSDPASISTPSSVETAPSNTGANMCSNARTALRFLSPMAVRNAWKIMKFMPSD